MVEETNCDIQIANAISHLREQWGELKPEIAIICGSGWGELSELFANSLSVSYENIPGMSATTVTGHAGNLHLCEINRKQILIFQGRRHLYEGVGWGPIRFPVLLASKLGTKNLLVTNAAGGINSSFKVGSLMLIEDHLNFMASNPLIGPISDPKIPRFPDQTDVYNIELRNRMEEVAKVNDCPLNRGVYVALSGPAFETPAEIKAFTILGADAVGMSTVPEAMLGHALGMKVVAISCISNLAAGISREKLSHEDVSQAAKIALPEMKKLISSFLADLLG